MGHHSQEGNCRCGSPGSVLIDIVSQTLRFKDANNWRSSHALPFTIAEARWSPHDIIRVNEIYTQAERGHVLALSFPLTRPYLPYHAVPYPPSL